MIGILKPLLPALLAISLIGAACGDPGSGDQTTPDAGAPDLPHNKAEFLTAVAAVPDRDITIYWLGDDPEIEGASLTGPVFVVTVAENTVDSFQYGYTIIPWSSLNVGMHTPAGWAEWERINANMNLGGARRETRQIEVRGANSAELVLTTLTETEPDNLILLAVVRYPGTVVTVGTQSTYDHQQGAEVNPLSSPEAFIDALQHLRPYPD
jgi:hypothetical protein